MANNAASPEGSLPYKIATSTLKDEDFETRPHRVDPTSIRKTISLGDQTGLKKLGVHYARLPPHAKSSALHWHTQCEEWVYILEAGDGAKLLTLPDGEKEPREEPVQAGDFFSFPAATKLGHCLVAGESEVVFLCSGTREVVDSCVYPLAGKTLFFDMDMKGGWMVDQSNLQPYEYRLPAPK